MNFTAFPVSLGLLCDSRTQDWGAIRFISEEMRGTRMRRKNRKNISICVF
jgi:hypothetical protein